MRQHLSVLMLAARSSIHRVLGLFAALAVTEGLLFYLTLQQASGNQPLGLEQAVRQSRIALVCGIGFILLCVLLSLTGSECGGGRLRYTVQRLSIREEATVGWWAVYNAICFFLFWVVQLAIALVLCQYYVHQMDGAYVSGQTAFLAFYRSNFLHSLLPLAEVSRYVRNCVLVLCLGVCASCFSFRQRRGERGVAVVALAVIVAVSFPSAMGSFGSDLLVIFLALCITAGAVAGIWKERGE